MHEYWYLKYLAGLPTSSSTQVHQYTRKYRSMYLGHPFPRPIPNPITPFQPPSAIVVAVVAVVFVGAATAGQCVVGCGKGCMWPKSLQDACVSAVAIAATSMVRAAVQSPPPHASCSLPDHNGVY
jgi:hypothetical protein